MKTQPYSFTGKVIALPVAAGIRPVELARRLNVSKQAMHGWKIRDGFPMSYKDTSGRVLLDANSVAEWLAKRGASVVRY